MTEYNLNEIAVYDYVVEVVAADGTVEDTLSGQWWSNNKAAIEWDLIDMVNEKYGDELSARIVSVDWSHYEPID